MMCLYQQVNHFETVKVFETVRNKWNIKEMCVISTPNASSIKLITFWNTVE